jgi:4-hydroxy-3-methylbut-2-enyl diphosphate reductase
VPEILVREVLEYLAARGYADVAPVVAAEESIMFSLPTEIRRDLKAAGKSDKVRHDASFAEAGSLH